MDETSVIMQMQMLLMGAGGSVYALGRSGMELLNLASEMAVDDRLDLRCLLEEPDIHDQDKPRKSTKRTVESLRRFGWQVKLSPFPSAYGCLIIDDQFAVLCDASIGFPITNEVIDDPSIVAAVSQDFKTKWQEASEIQHVYRDARLFEAEARAAVVACAGPVWDDLIRRLSQNPDLLHDLTARRFEELVAELLERDGLCVQLTPASKDGGRDILVWSKAQLGECLFLVECKKHAPSRPVGVDIVRSLYGVVEKNRASAGTLVTTSHFTKGARQFCEELRYRMAMKDYDDLVRWIRALNVTRPVN